MTEKERDWTVRVLLKNLDFTTCTFDEAEEVAHALMCVLCVYERYGFKNDRIFYSFVAMQYAAKFAYEYALSNAACVKEIKDISKEDIDMIHDIVNRDCTELSYKEQKELFTDVQTTCHQYCEYPYPIELLRTFQIVSKMEHNRALEDK